MKKSTLFSAAKLRMVSQLLFFLLFFRLLLFLAKTTSAAHPLTAIFFYLDPLLFLITLIATHVIIPLFLISLIPLLLSLVFGRFFCGWICPLGSIHHFFSWLFRRTLKDRFKYPVWKKSLKIKYIVLLIILGSALMGSQFAGWLDPISFLTRTSSAVLLPAGNQIVQQTLKAGSNDQNLLGKTLKYPYQFAQKNILNKDQRYSSDSILIGLLFLGFILLNAVYPRFYCNFVCPLGALYGLISRFSFFHLKINQSCKSCNLCSKNCTYQGSPFLDYQKADCLVCLNCLDDCPHHSIDMQLTLPKKTAPAKIDFGRRKIIGSMASGIFIGALPQVFLHHKQEIHSFCRPPGSVAENDFLARCIRCGQCIQACPTNFIQPALFQAGLEGLWTPVLNPQIGYCEYECHQCTLVCPTKAIEVLDILAKKNFKIGTAVIDRNRCYTYADGYNCAVCEEHCPIPDKAIKLREVPVWNFKGEQVMVNQIYVDPEKCIGCGICENVCPRIDAPGIFLSAEEEQRQAQY